jgi:hypothetical protein
MMKRGALPSFLIGSAALALFAYVSPPAAAQGQPLIFLGPCGEFGYRPVCARSRKNTLVTYANACIARSEGSRVISHEACPTACPMIFRPVCATDSGGKRTTFGNECQANVAGAKIIRAGRCVPLIR